MSSILNTYNRKKINFTKGKGSFLYSKSGKKYLDFIQGIAVNCLGHANDYLIKSVYKQSKKLWHISNVFTIPEQERLAKRLTQKTFADFVAFQNSGAEATEAAIKFARRYFYSKGQPKKIEFYVLIIVFTEERSQLFLLAIAKRLQKVLVRKQTALTILILETIRV